METDATNVTTPHKTRRSPPEVQRPEALWVSVCKYQSYNPGWNTEHLTYARKIAPEEELLQEYLRVQKTECDAELEEELSQLAKPFLECTIHG